MAANTLRLPKGCHVEVRTVDESTRTAFGFIYLSDGTRVGFITAKGSGNIELWIANWGTPANAELRKAQYIATMFLAPSLPWTPEVIWKDEAR